MTVSPPPISVADLHVGSAVYSSNGEKVGRLRFMVVDPETESVSHLVLEKGMLLGHDVLAPVTSVQQVLHRGIFLSLSSEEILNQPEFNEARYLQRERSGGGGGGGGHHHQGSHQGGGGGGEHHRRPGKRFRRH